MAKKKQSIEGFINPFDDGVSYDDLLSAIPEGTSVEDYLKDELSDDQIKVITAELKLLKKNSETVEEVESIKEKE